MRGPVPDELLVRHVRVRYSPKLALDASLLLEGNSVFGWGVRRSLTRLVWEEHDRIVERIRQIPNRP